MSIKTTRDVDRGWAIAIILANVGKVSNKVLGDILDVIADSDEVEALTALDNFQVGHTSPWDSS